MEAEVTTIAPTAAHSREDVNAWPTGGKLPGFECGYAHRRRCAVLMHCRVSSRSVTARGTWPSNSPKHGLCPTAFFRHPFYGRS